MPASITQSVGVPDTAKRLGPALRKRKGSDSVSECDAPDCSVSGATTQMSSESVRAIFSATASPGAWMPSSFETRIRSCFFLRVRAGTHGVMRSRPPM